MITKKIAIHVIQGERLGNSNWQMGQTFAFSSTSIAQEGHSLVFTVLVNSLGLFPICALSKVKIQSNAMRKKVL